MCYHEGRGQAVGSGLFLVALQFQQLGMSWLLPCLHQPRRRIPTGRSRRSRPAPWPRAPAWRPATPSSSINGHRLRDVIDFRFYSADDELAVEVRRGERRQTLHLVHGPEDALGMELRGDGLELITECNNHCPFCFVTQLPTGMRRTLSIKDDDYRYSFLYANFVTLTNLSDDDWARIEEQRLSPLYVSVHSTDVQMRRKLLGNRFAEDPLEQIDRLGRLGITVHTQLVTCPGINDGPYLERSIADLMARFPQVQTIAAVPVGLTRIRTERTMSRGMPLRKFQPDEALRAVETIEAVQAENMRRYGVPVVYASDEFYLVAGRAVSRRPRTTTTGRSSRTASAWSASC